MKQSIFEIILSKKYMILVAILVLLSCLSNPKLVGCFFMFNPQGEKYFSDEEIFKQSSTEPKGCQLNP